MPTPCLSCLYVLGCAGSEGKGRVTKEMGRFTRGDGITKGRVIAWGVP